MLKCTKFNFGWGSALDTAGGAYSAPPDPLVGLRGRGLKGEEGGARREREGEGEPSGGEGTRPHPFTPLIHISAVWIRPCRPPAMQCPSQTTPASAPGSS